MGLWMSAKGKGAHLFYVGYMGAAACVFINKKRCVHFDSAHIHGLIVLSSHRLIVFFINQRISLQP